ISMRVCSTSGAATLRCLLLPYTTLFRSGGGGGRPLSQPRCHHSFVRWARHFRRVALILAALLLLPGGASGQATQPAGDDPAAARSEEHTSELQSRENLVCRLLLEKKKTM